MSINAQNPAAVLIACMVLFIVWFLGWCLGRRQAIFEMSDNKDSFLLRDTLIAVVTFVLGVSWLAVLTASLIGTIKVALRVAVVLCLGCGSALAIPENPLLD